MITLRVSNNIELNSPAFAAIAQQIKAMTGLRELPDAIFFEPLQISDKNSLNVHSSDSFVSGSSNIIDHNEPNSDPENPMFLSAQQVTSYDQFLIERVESIFNGIHHLIEKLDTSRYDAWIEQEKAQLIHTLRGYINTSQDIKKSGNLVAETCLNIALALIPAVEKKDPDFFSGRDQKVLKMLQLLDRSEEFYIASKPRNILCTVIKIGENLHAQIDMPINCFSEGSALGNELQKIHDLFHPDPAWYAKLPYLYRDLISEWVTEVFSNPGQIYTLSSRSDLVPGLRNFLRHYSIFCNADGETYVSTALRSSHIGGRPSKLEAISDEDMHHFASLNFYTLSEWIFEHCPEKRILLYQTLLTPLPTTPDKTLCELKKSIISEFQKKNSALKIISVNHGVNAARGLTALFETTDMPRLLPLVDQDSPPVYKAAFRELSDMQQHHYGMIKSSFSGMTRQLHLSSVEALAARHHPDVIAYITCISGKDRTGLEILYTDALESYFYTYGQFFSFHACTDEHIFQFYQIFAQLFYSNHAQCIASDNSPGAFGLKELGHNASRHLAAMLPPDRFRIENALGNLNSLIKMAAKAENCQDLLNASAHPHYLKQQIVRILQKNVPEEKESVQLRTAFFEFLKINREVFARLTGPHSFKTKSGLQFRCSEYLHQTLCQWLAVLDADIRDNSEEKQHFLSALAASLIVLPSRLSTEESMIVHHILQIFQEKILPTLSAGHLQLIMAKNALNQYLLAFKNSFEQKLGYVYLVYHSHKGTLEELNVSKDFLNLLTLFDNCLKACLADPEHSSSHIEKAVSGLSHYEPKTLSLSGFFKPSQAADAEKNTVQFMLELLEPLAPARQNRISN